MNHTDNIIRLIKVLAHPYSMLVFPINLWEEEWDGIRLYKKGYELFKIEEIPIEERAELFGAEQREYTLSSDYLYEKDERYLQEILEEFLMDI